ncbi:CDP-alcohol phosphatidyltransferase family protein [Microbacterium thalassium]|uniref:CDP-diacylglycerol--glycerol-3-phosphate 3-phosphatidyltransferase n=1 Tax=Microbacterium thalassium TaxID=362649 RepID=A0A7X0KVW9_9MICO|nr:CDP-alcohol phosphatidyltransferase family protein [Microbacterium thalassium]MBB6392672.1 CDP-diacylglycerol--glycerol-3-phosphate 3-phosphatidyltransferase [Microbacterium thalassium]GLK23097.1 hypothetical protein GCM10017607_04150 [Microbacterium thalassium]
MPAADILSLLRIPIGIAMVVVAWTTPGASTAIGLLFVAGALTDLLDGPIARRTGSASERGARLDSVADAVFVALTAVAVVLTVRLPSDAWVWLLAGLVVLLRLAAVAVVRMRFGAWSITHTWGNRLTGLALAIVAGIALFRGEFDLISAGVVIALGVLSALEDLAIAVTADRLDRDRRSLWARAG